MADAKKCDVCGKFYVPPLGTALIINTYSLWYNGGFGGGMFYDLCSDCQKNLNDFVKSLKEHNND